MMINSMMHELPVPSVGRLFRSRIPGPFMTVAELLDIWESEGVTLVVPLMEGLDYAEFGVSDMPGHVAERSWRCHLLPIPDGGVSTAQQMSELIDVIHNELSEGGGVLVHCIGGRGRTGLALACYAVRHLNMEAEEAIEWVREHSLPGSLETTTQEQFVREFN